MPDQPIPAARPQHYDAQLLFALRRNPPRLGAWVMARREQLFGRETLLWPAPALTGEAPRIGLLHADGQLESRDDDAWWPTLTDCAGARVLVGVEAEQGPRAEAYIAWLLRLAEQVEHAEGPLPRSVVPFSTQPAGTHRLWLIATARLVLPGEIRVEARHDLVGIRLAQIALGFGADTLSGPVESDRRLPVAGVTRPNEASSTGLRNLIEQAGLEPRDAT